MLIAFYMELSAGGFGLAGAVALISLFLIMLSSFALEAVHWLEPILIFFGLVLIGLELFFFPTLGILGLVGGVFLIMGMAGIMLPGIESVSYQGNGLNAAGEYVLTRLTWLSGSLLVAIVVIAILSRYMWPKFALFQRLVLTESKRSQAAIEGTLPPSPLTALPPLGAQAIVSRALRPAGKIKVGVEEYDAVSTGNFIQEGAKVRISRIEGAKVIVEEIYS
jgi:membrane-bound ClpP family serine protease